MGNATALMVAIKGLPLAYNKDLQETQEPLFDSSDTMLQMLPLVAGWMKAVEFNRERTEQAAQTGFMNAWAAATYLVKRGVPSRMAHERSARPCKLYRARLRTSRPAARRTAIAECGVRSGFLRVAEAGFGAGSARCCGRHGAGPRTTGNQRYQEENRISPRGGPCARVKQFCPTQNRFTS